MLHRIPSTTIRSGIYYTQFWWDKKLIKYSLETDSYRKAADIMIQVQPAIIAFKKGKITREALKMVVKKHLFLDEKIALVESAIDACDQAESFSQKMMEKFGFNRSAIASKTEKMKSDFDDAERKSELYVKHREKNAELFNKYPNDKAEVNQYIDYAFEVMGSRERLLRAKMSGETDIADELEIKLHNQLSLLHRTKDKLTPVVPAPIHHAPQKPKPLLFSEASELLFKAKEKRWSDKNIGKDIQDNYPKNLKRQRQYAKKIIAITNDYDLHSISKSELFELLSQLFFWPDETQKGSKYNSRQGLKKGEDRPLSRYIQIASEIEKIKLDSSVEKADGVVADILGYMQELYKWLVASDYIKQSPVKQVMPWFQDLIDDATEKRGAYSAPEMRRIIDFVIDTNSSVKWPVLLMSYTGARNSELYCITPADINVEQKFFFIDGKKTNTAKRYIPIAPKLIEHGLLDFIKHIPQDQPILKNEAPEQNLNARYESLIEPLGIPKQIVSSKTKEVVNRSFYSLRKAFSTHNRSTNSNKKEIVMGHSVLSSDRPEEGTYLDSDQLAYTIEEVNDYREVVERFKWDENILLQKTRNKE